MDANCIVCGETWCAEEGITDMEPWEFDLFRKGAGCPSCEGVSNGYDASEDYANAEFGDEDPTERIMAISLVHRPKWEKPTK